MTNFLLPLMLGYLLDILIGDPEWLYKIIPHPIVIIGKIISLSEKSMRAILGSGKRRERIAGAFMVLIVIAIVSGGTYGIILLANMINTWLGLAVSTLFCFQILATKSLKVASKAVYKQVKYGSLNDSRRAVSYIVGRDTSELTQQGVIKATVETVAENTNDGVVAPIFFIVLGGPVAGMVYKAINTMDSMVGYKNDKYMYFGTFAAKLDDVASYIPARLSALLMIVSSFLLGYNSDRAYRIWRRDRRNHSSPNSAQTESVVAGALNIQLAGDAYYFGKLYKKPTIGDNGRPITPEDILRVNQLMDLTSLLCIFLAYPVNNWIIDLIDIFIV